MKKLFAECLLVLFAVSGMVAFSAASGEIREPQKPAIVHEQNPAQASARLAGEAPQAVR